MVNLLDYPSRINLAEETLRALTVNQIERILYNHKGIVHVSPAFYLSMCMNIITYS